MLGLRLTEGIGAKRFYNLTSFELLEVIDQQASARLVGDGFLRQSPGKLSVTPKGRLLLDSLTRILLTGSP